MLDTLVVSADAKLISTIQSACAKLGMTAKMCATPKAVPAILARNKLYGVVMDGLDSGKVTEVLTAFRESASSRFVVSIVVGGLQASGASQVAFVIPNPVTEKIAIRTLRVAQGQMCNELRRYIRHPLSAPITLTSDRGQQLEVISRNISQRGLGILFAKSHLISVGAQVCARFALPGVTVPIQCKGRVVWSDGLENAGISCDGNTPTDRQQLQSWVAKRVGV